MTGIWVAAFVLQWLLLVIVSLLVVGILRQLGSYRYAASEALSGTDLSVSRFEVGAPLPLFSATDVNGVVFNFSEVLGRERSILLLFISPGCQSCDSLLAKLREIAQRPGGLEATGWTVILAVVGRAEIVRRSVANFPELLGSPVHILVDEGSRLGHEFGFRVTPIGVAMTAAGNIVDQSFNPHSEWLYDMLEVPKPEQPVRAPGRGGREAFFAPVMMKPRQ